jgi:hypothetical protein
VSTTVDNTLAAAVDTKTVLIDTKTVVDKMSTALANYK